MTRVHGKLFSDGRNGLLVVKPSQPFFGVARHERHFDVTDGSIDINLDPTPAGVTYLVAYKEKGDIRKTDFTLKWRVPDREAYDITPGATQASSTASVVQSATVYERVQLRRAASELGDALEEQVRLESSLLSAQQRISVLEEQLRDFRNASEEALVARDRTIAQMAEQTAPEVQTIYVDRPVPPAPLEERIRRLEAENQRLARLNAEYYESVVQLHQLQLDKARNTPPPVTVEQGNSPQQRLRRKLLGN